MEYGLDGLFYFLSPEGKYINIVLTHPQVSRDDVQEQYNVLDEAYADTANHVTNVLPSSRYDHYDKQNSVWSASYILASVSTDLRNQLLTKVGLDYNKGPVVWMFLMGMLGSTTARGFRTLRAQFEDRKLRSEPGENVRKHTLKVRNDYKRLCNANVPLEDSLLTVIDNMLDSSTSAFNSWSGAKHVEVLKFTKEYRGKSDLVKSQVKDAPTVEGICDEADDMYESLVTDWVATDSKKDKQAVPSGFLMTKMSKAIDKLTLSQSKNDVCWTCGKAGHRSPECPDKGKSEGKSKGFAKNKRFPAQTKTRNWQNVKPAAGEAETIVIGTKTFYWCDCCSHWRTTHGTSGHILESVTKPKTSGGQAKSEDQANLAEIVQLGGKLAELKLGAWCAVTVAQPNTVVLDFPLGVFEVDFNVAAMKRHFDDLSPDMEVDELSLSSDSIASDDVSQGWIEVLSSNKRVARNTDICTVCRSKFYSPPNYGYTICTCCTGNNLKAPPSSPVSDEEG